jgi:hypothetical protein
VALFRVLAWGGWQSMADEEVRNQNFREHIKKSPAQKKLAINISPYFFVHH